MPSPTNRAPNQTISSADINALAVVANGAESAAAAAAARANHTGTQDISTVTGVLPDAQVPAAITRDLESVGYQVWNGTAWSTRPTGFGHVEAYSDGTRGSVTSVSAPAPTGAVNGDRWWKALA